MDAKKLEDLDAKFFASLPRGIIRLLPWVFSTKMWEAEAVWQQGIEDFAREDYAKLLKKIEEFKKANIQYFVGDPLPVTPGATRVAVDRTTCDNSCCSVVAWLLGIISYKIFRISPEGKQCVETFYCVAENNSKLLDRYNELSEALCTVSDFYSRHLRYGKAAQVLGSQAVTEERIRSMRKSGKSELNQFSDILNKQLHEALNRRAGIDSRGSYVPQSSEVPQ